MAAKHERRFVRQAVLTGVSVAMLGCTGSPGANPATQGQQALISIGGSALIAGIDGQDTQSAFASPELRVAPGRHALSVRRRKEIQTGKPVPSDATVIIAMAWGTTTVVSHDTCTLDVELQAGGEYRLVTNQGGDEWSWTASLSGPGSKATCSPQVTARDLVGRDLYLCCTMRFSGGEATDANYLYDDSAESTLPAGTKVRVTEVERFKVKFSPADGRRYQLWFQYGGEHLDSRLYFERLFLASDPTATLAGLSPDVAAAVRAGRVVVGMTKAQVLLARGYPPGHQTPDLEASEWLYYDSPGVGEYVVFANGVVTATRRGPAP